MVIAVLIIGSVGPAGGSVGLFGLFGTETGGGAASARPDMFGGLVISCPSRVITVSPSVCGGAFRCDEAFK